MHTFTEQMAVTHTNLTQGVMELQVGGSFVGLVWLRGWVFTGG